MNPDRLIVLRDLERPPEAWRYTVPETGVTITADFYHLLYPLVVAHCRANSVPMGDDFDQIVEDGACRETQGAKCGKAKPKPVAGMPPLTLDLVERFIRSIWGAIRERQFVTQTEAERRAAICASCPLAAPNDVGRCKSCFSLLGKATKLAVKSQLPIPQDKELCIACGCMTQLKCRISNAALDKAEGSQRPRYAEGHCWRLGF